MSIPGGSQIPAGLSLVIRNFLFLLFFLSLTACTSNNEQFSGVPPEDRQVSVEAPIDDILRFDDSVSLDEVIWDGDVTLHLRITGDGKTYYGYSNPSLQQSLSVHSNWIPVFQILLTDEKTFIEQKAKGTPLLVLNHEHWQAVLDKVVDWAMPIEQEAAVLINIRDREHVAYRDSDNNPVILDGMENKPPDMPLLINIRIEELGASLFDLISRYALEQGIENEYLFFSTGEVGPYARPVAMLDRANMVVNYGSLEPFTFGSMPNNYLGEAGKAGVHLVRSYPLEFVNRPVTFVSRLIFFLFDTVVDFSRGMVIQTFAYPDIEESEIPPLHAGEGMDLVAWEEQLDKSFGDRDLYGTIDTLVDGDLFFPRLVDAILDAEQSVKLRTYIFDRDDYAIRLAKLLKRKSRDDVHVQITVDGLGTLMAQRKAAGTMPPEFEAPYGITLFLENDSQVEVRSLTNPWFTGDHSKTTVIDSKIAFIGGMNIGREYRWEWHDVMMEARGPIVEFIEREFDKTWAMASVLGDFVFAGYVAAHPAEYDELETGYPIRPLVTLQHHSEIYRAQLKAIRRAKKYIYVQNAYFSDITMIHALSKARLRGVDVRVIIPMEGNHGIMNQANVVAANTLLRYGARVWVYPGMSHVKAAVFDGWSCLGSANFDKLSFRVNKEMNLASSAPKFTDQILDEIFYPDFETAVELTEPLPENWGNTFALIVASQL